LLNYWTISRNILYSCLISMNRMEKSGYFTNPINWVTEDDSTIIDNFEDKLTLLENPAYKSVVNHPVKLNAVVSIICTKGHIDGTLNLKKFTAKAPCLFIVLADQILQCDYFSDDFSGLSIIMSKSFLEDLFVDIQVSMPLFRSVLDNPWILLNQEELKSMLEYFFLLQRTVRRKENPNLQETLKHITLGFFYGIGYRFHMDSEESQKSKQDILVEKFLAIVKENYRKQRMIEFYSEKLFLTPKHLSRVIKVRSGKSAGEWIEDHVMLEAMALLKSTDKTIQQISDELNFQSQSFFGKYFKRRTGISPKEYRKSS
jgi:AraC family transcriptional regulator, transcriptional activator of pobA